MRLHWKNSAFAIFDNIIIFLYIERPKSRKCEKIAIFLKIPITLHWVSIGIAKASEEVFCAKSGIIPKWFHIKKGYT